MFTHGVRPAGPDATTARGLIPEGGALLSTNDLVEAYRQCPVSSRGAQASIVVIWSAEPSHCMYGVPFVSQGTEVAVVVVVCLSINY